MAQLPVQPPDDPALKAALRRVLGQETAPAALRARIQSLASTAAEEKPLRIPARRGPLYKLAMAAAILLCFGFAGYRIWQETRPPAYQQQYAVPNTVYKAMTEAHAARGEQKASPPDSATTLADAQGLAAQVKRPVFVPELEKNGWTFKGGAVRKLAGRDTAQLFFTKGSQTLSVFSFPADVAPKAIEDTSYDTTFQNLPIAGFVKKGGLFCIVGDPSIPLPDVKMLLESHRADLKV
jgi:hypothetical protein